MASLNDFFSGKTKGRWEMLLWVTMMTLVLLLYYMYVKRKDVVIKLSLRLTQINGWSTLTGIMFIFIKIKSIDRVFLSF
jgi:hypothetical protein